MAGNKSKGKKTSPGLIIVALIVIFIGFYQLKQTYPDLTFPIINQYEDEPKKVTGNGSPFKYYYGDLSNKEKQAYNLIMDEIYDMPEKILVPDLNEEELSSVFAALLKDNPDLFFIGRHCEISAELWNCFFSAEYCMTKEEYRVKKAELDRACSKVLSGLTDKSNVWQTELEIHNYIVDNCSYNMKDDDFICSSSYGCLVDNEAACEGYAKAAKLLFDRLGIENYVVNGEAVNNKESSGAHMWNVVKVNGKFCHLDCTWDDPVNKDRHNLRLYSYFNVSDEFIGRNHTGYAEFEPCDSMDEYYYVKKGLEFDSFGYETGSEIGRAILREYNSGERQIQLRFADRTIYRKAYAELIANRGIFGILRKIKTADGKTLAEQFDSFSENPDFFILTFIFKGGEQNG